MPKVGSKHYSYSPKGRAQARQEARRTGRKVQTGYTYGNPGKAGKTPGIQGQTCK
ncbi:hypothetical protein [uncultured Mediterranean phage uvDeep-CGR2-KM23-C246]|nr:hypothetical protein [uncultured Mediterranean phage uvDeep-CGR2-KM23-C246]